MHNPKHITAKITKRFNILLTIFLVTSWPGFAQDSLQIKLDVTTSLKEYHKQVNDDSTKQMVELKSMIPGLIYDLRYATTNNFTQQRMYLKELSITYLRRPAVSALKQVQRELNQKGLGLKIFDAYRPYSVTVKFWELIKDEKYVANPAKGSGHNRGIAVDLTIINKETGKELNMGTGFDNFSDTAHQSFIQLPKEILQNRSLLRSTMEKYGFTALETEWWHYYLPATDKYEVLDIDFEKLKINQSLF